MIRFQTILLHYVEKLKLTTHNKTSLFSHPSTLNITRTIIAVFGTSAVKLSPLHPNNCSCGRALEDIGGALLPSSGAAEYTSRRKTYRDAIGGGMN